MAALRRLGWLCLCACTLPPAASAATLDLSAARIVVAAPASPRSHTYAQLLSDEVFKRVFVRWPIANGTAASGAGGVTITLGTDSPAEVDRSSPRAEGFALSVGAAGVHITGVPTTSPRQGRECVPGTRVHHRRASEKSNFRFRTGNRL